MGDQITISIWLFLLLVAVALAAVLDRVLNALASRGAPVFEVHGSRRARVISEGLDMLFLRRLIAEERGRLRAVAAEQALLTYYANAIAHGWQPFGRPSCATALPEGSS